MADSGRLPLLPPLCRQVDAALLLPRDAPPPPDVEALILGYADKLELICPADQRVHRPCAALDASQRSSARREHLAVLPFQFSGLGVWNGLVFSTKTQSGQPKRRGGDVWWATLRDEEQGLRIPARVFDQARCAR